MFVNSPEKHIIYPDPDLKKLDLDPSSVVRIHQKVKRIEDLDQKYCNKNTFWKYTKKLKKRRMELKRIFCAFLPVYFSGNKLSQSFSLL